MGSDSREQVDYLIVGQGLAGSLLALNLFKRGKLIRVIDDGHKHAASKVAAGLINPITGRRHALTWRFLEFWNFLQSDYVRWEELLGDRFFHEIPLLRFFKNDEEQARFEKKWEAGGFEGIKVQYPGSMEGVPFCKYEELSYRLTQSGYVDQALFIKRVRQFLEQESVVVTNTWSEADVSREPGEVRWKAISAKAVIFTQGFMASENRYFRDLPFRHAKGQILDLHGPERPHSPILNRGKWLLPTGPGSFKAGATYDLNNINQEVTEDASAEILDAVDGMVDGDFQVRSAKAGVRPALHDFKPVLGKHPWYPEWIIFNGLGSKGSLQGPLLAKELVDHLEDGVPLPAEADVDRFRKYL